MISTVTSSTVSTVTTAVLSSSVALVGILILLSLLVQKELASTAAAARWRKFGRVLNIAIVPLLFAFGLMMVTKIVAALQ